MVSKIVWLQLIHFSGSNGNFCQGRYKLPHRRAFQATGFKSWFPLLEFKASTNLFNFEMIGSWPTHAEKRGEKDIFVEQDPINPFRRRPITDLFPLWCVFLLSSKNQSSHFVSKWCPILKFWFHLLTLGMQWGSVWYIFNLFHMLAPLMTYELWISQNMLCA